MIHYNEINKISFTYEGQDTEDTHGRGKLLFDKEVIFDGLSLDLAYTVDSFYKGIKKLLQNGKDSDYYFWHSCGVRGCLVNKWILVLQNDRVLIEIDIKNGLGDIIARQYYSILKTEFIKMVLDILDISGIVEPNEKDTTFSRIKEDLLKLLHS